MMANARRRPLYTKLETKNLKLKDLKVFLRLLNMSSVHSESETPFQLAS